MSYVFRQEQKTGSDGADVICCGRLFQVRTAATGNAQIGYEYDMTSRVYDFVVRHDYEGLRL